MWLWVLFFIVFVLQGTELHWYLLFLTPFVCAFLDMAFVQKYWSKDNRAYQQRHGIRFWE